MREENIWEIKRDGLENRLSDIVTFLRSQQPLNSTWSEQYFKAKLEGINEFGTGYLFYAEANGEIVGTASLTKKPGILHGQPCLLAEVGDTFVSKHIIRHGKPLRQFDERLPVNHYLNKSIFAQLISMLLDQARQDGVALVFGTPNAQSLPGYIKRLGFIGDEIYQNTTYYRPTVHGLVDRFKFILPAKALLLGAEWFFNKLLGLFFVRLRGISVECLSEITSLRSEIDALWASNSNAMSFGLRRNFNYWVKRFSDEMGNGYRFLALRKNNGDLIGLIVLRSVKTSESRVGLAIVEWIGSSDISLINVVAAVTAKMRCLGKFSHAFIWSGANTPKARNALWTALFALQKKAPIIFKPTLGDVPKSNVRFVFHLGSSDAV